MAILAGSFFPSYLEKQGCLSVMEPGKEGDSAFARMDAVCQSEKNLQVGETEFQRRYKKLARSSHYNVKNK